MRIQCEAEKDKYTYIVFANSYLRWYSRWNKFSLLRRAINAECNIANSSFATFALVELILFPTFLLSPYIEIKDACARARLTGVESAFHAHVDFYFTARVFVCYPLSQASRESPLQHFHVALKSGGYKKTFEKHSFFSSPICATMRLVCRGAADTYDGNTRRDFAVAAYLLPLRLCPPLGGRKKRKLSIPRKCHRSFSSRQPSTFLNSFIRFKETGALKTVYVPSFVRYSAIISRCSITQLLNSWLFPRQRRVFKGVISLLKLGLFLKKNLHLRI